VILGADEGANMIVLRAAALIVFLLAPAFAGAQTPRSLICSFRSVSVGELTQRYEAKKPGEQFGFTLGAIDLASGKAEMIGNAGSAPVTTIGNDERLQFLEVTPAGNISTTSVFPKVGGGKDFPAVHSRHMLSFGSSAIVSQYAGTCSPRY
jgi:hypothetical protein